MWLYFRWFKWIFRVTQANSKNIVHREIRIAKFKYSIEFIVTTIKISFNSIIIISSIIFIADKKLNILKILHAKQKTKFSKFSFRNKI